MFCPRCGKQNPEGATFCDSCGNLLQSSNIPHQQNFYAPPQGGFAPQAQPYAAYPQTPKSSHKGLIIGIATICVILAAAAVVLVILLTGGTSVVGQWYGEEHASVIEFKANGDFIVYTDTDENEGEYEYDKGKGEGVITVHGAEHDFTVDKDTIVVADIGTYKRAGRDFDIDEFFEETAVVSPPPATVVPTMEVTPAPTAAVETVTDQTMTLQFSFGERTGTYSGEAVGGLPEGYGTFVSSNTDGTAWTYKGAWVSGHFSGQGQTVWADGFSEMGQYQDDALNGEGSEYWYDKVYYSGGYLNSNSHGLGTLYSHFGEAIYTGNWAYGYIQESPEDRSDRVGAFKDQSIPATSEELYSSCENLTDIRVQVQGVVLDVYEYGEGSEYYCDFLMYEQGYEDTGHIIQVFYRLSEGEPTVTEGQSVTVWGTTGYLYSYTTESNEDLTVPLIQAYSVE